MVRIKLGLPVDSTFLSEVIYEGIVFTLSTSSKTSFNEQQIELKNTFLEKAFRSLSREAYENIKIGLTGNDNLNTELFKKLSLRDVSSKKSIRDIVKTLCDNDNIKNLKVEKDEINLRCNINGRVILFDTDDKKEGLSFQLLKLDRYTGLTSTETEYTSKQLTSYFSKELILISLIGICSSYVSSVFIPSTKGVQSSHYFLFISPEEVLRILSKGDIEFVKKILKVKNKVREVIQEILKYTSLNEVLLLELTLNVELHRLMDEENLDKVSTTLFRVNPEGQTYKVYEAIPITIFKDTLFHEKVKDYFGERSEQLLESVEYFLSDSRVRYVLKSLKEKETNNIILAVQSLYRAIILGDMQGFFGFMREVWNAHEKVKDKANRSPYLFLLKKFPY